MARLGAVLSLQNVEGEPERYGEKFGVLLLLVMVEWLCLLR